MKSLFPECNEPDDSKLASCGIIYVLWYEGHPDKIKIGQTTRTLEQRMREIKKTGIPGEALCGMEIIETDDPVETERSIHLLLNKWRVHGAGKDWFYSKKFLDQCDPLAIPYRQVSALQPVARLAIAILDDIKSDARWMMAAVLEQTRLEEQYWAILRSEARSSVDDNAKAELARRCRIAEIGLMKNAGLTRRLVVQAATGIEQDLNPYFPEDCQL